LVLKKSITILSIILFIFILACDKENNSGQEIPYDGFISNKLTPTSIVISGPTNKLVNVENLTDNSIKTTASLSGSETVEMTFDGTHSMNGLKINSPSTIDITVYSSLKGVKNDTPLYTGTITGANQWQRVEFSTPADGDKIFISMTGATSSTIAEIEVWNSIKGTIKSGTIAHSLYNASSYTAILSQFKQYHDHIKTYKADTQEVVLLNTSGSTEKTAFFQCDIPYTAQQIMRAYLVYNGTNIEKPSDIKRRINLASWIDLADIPQKVTTNQWFAEEINPQWLKQGQNKIELSSSLDSVTIKDLQIVVVLNNGFTTTIENKNNLSDGNITTGIASNENINVELNAQYRLWSLMFYSSASMKSTCTITPVNNSIPGTPYLKEIDIKQGWNQLKIDSSVIANKVTLSFTGTSSKVNITEVLFSGSCTARQFSDDELVVSFPRSGEFYGRNALIRGFLRNSKSGFVSVAGNASTLNSVDGSFQLLVNKDKTQYKNQQDNDLWTLVVSSSTTTTQKIIPLNSNKRQSDDSTVDSGSSGNSGSGSGGSSSDDSDTTVSDDGLTTMIYPSLSKVITFGSVTLNIPAGSVSKATEIKIIPLGSDDIQGMNKGMTNVTSPASGYRFLPHGVFQKNLSIKISYDKKLFLPGQKDKDVHMFFFDEKDKIWKRLDREGVSSNSSYVVARTNHFTDIINATIVVPEHPDPLGYNPNSMKDIKAGNPGSKVNLVKAPQASNMGDASVQYPIELPKGRAGMTPSVSVRYSSSGGNGVMGVGWDLSVDSISIDTRFGVPRYSKTIDERYTYNGQVLVPIGPRVEGKPRQYRPRVERAFSIIERHGDNPYDYHWKVTDKSGTVFTYGNVTAVSLNNSANANLSNPTTANNNIFKWYLKSVKDLHGNMIVYNYVYVSQTPQKGAVGGNVYLKEILYAGGNYKVNFTYDDGKRTDVRINCRGGFKVVTQHLLKSIDVSYNGGIIRKYGFYYKNDETTLFKTLLNTASQYGKGGSVKFHDHTFEYHNDNIYDNTDSSFQGFSENTQQWTGAKTFEGAGVRKKSLSFSIGGGGGGSFYAGLGFTKNYSAGIKVAASGSGSGKYCTMVDIDGDGLPDQVFMVGSTLSYNRNLSASGEYKFATTQGVTSNFNNVGYVDGVNLSVGAQFHAQNSSGTLGFSAIADVSWNISTEKDYFLDVNGDGLVDFIKDTNVYFNHRDNITGMHNFTPSVPDGFKNTGTLDVISVQLPNTSKDELSKKYFLDDPVLMWEAPFGGLISIKGICQLLPKKAVDGVINYKNEDGVQVKVFRNNDLLWSRTIARDNNEEITPQNMSDVWIEKGEKLYFTVNSIDNGENDIVKWDPVISYPAFSNDILDENNNSIYKYQASKGFALSGSEKKIKIPYKSTATISGSIKKSKYTADNIVLHIKRNGTLIIEKTLNNDFIETESFKMNNVSFDEGDLITCELISDIKIDWSAIKFNGKITYQTVVKPAFGDESEKELTSDQVKKLKPIILIPEIMNFNRFNLREKPYYTVIKDGLATLKYKVSKYDDSFSGPFYQDTQDLKTLPDGYNSTVAIAAIIVRKEGSTEKIFLIDKQKDVFDSLEDEIIIEKQVSLLEGDKVYFVATSTADDIQKYISMSSGSIVYDDDIENSIILESTISFPKDLTISFLGGNRGWYYGRINGNIPFDVNNFNLDGQSIYNNLKITEDNYNTEKNQKDIADAAIKATYFTAMSINGSDEKWHGYDDAYIGFISRDDIDSDNQIFCMSSTRIGIKNLTTDTSQLVLADAAKVKSTTTPGSGTGSASRRFPWKLSVNFSVAGGISTSAGFAGLGGTVTSGDSNTYEDVIDLNGDRYPDHLYDNGVTKYTNPDGSLGGKTTVSSAVTSASTKVRAIHNIAASLNASAKVGLGGRSPELQSFDMSIPGERFIAPSTFPHSISVGANGSAGYQIVMKDFVDLNGDGLLDIIYVKGDIAAVDFAKNMFGIKDAQVYVKYNLGYSFSDAEKLDGVDYFRRTASGSGLTEVGSWNVGYAIKASGFGASAGVNSSVNATEFDLIDINGDGLPDRVAKAVKLDDLKCEDGVRMIVQFNTGNGFTKTYVWKGSLPNQPIRRSVTLSESVSGSFSIEPKVWPVVFNFGLNGNVNQSGVDTSLSDINGDGLVDHVYSDIDGNIGARLNTIKKTNLLKKVTNPLKGSFEIDYTRSSNTVNMPQSRWVMASVKVNDGMSGHDSTTSPHEFTTVYKYYDGYHDRTEREFLGFENIIESHIKSISKPNVFMSKRTYYHNSDIYKKGIAWKTIVYEGSKDATASKVFGYTESLYKDKELIPSSDSKKISKFVFLERKDQYNFEGSATYSEDKKIPDYSTSLMKQSRQEFTYDDLGNVKTFKDYGDFKNQDDDLTATISYYTGNLPHHLLSKPIGIAVNGKGKWYRSREASYDKDTGELTQVIQKNTSSNSVTDLVWKNGNLLKVIGPANKRGQRYYVEYSYGKHNIHVTGIKDSFGYTSSSTYDYFYGVVKTTKDTNNNRMEYYYDDFGRLKSVYGPNDIGKSPTFSFAYNISMFPAMARTKNKPRSDKNEHIETIVYTDGLKRVVQTQKESDVLQGGSVVNGFVVSGSVLYNEKGQVVKQGQPTFVAGLSGAFKTLTSPINPTIYEYDVRDRKTKVTNPDGKSVTMKYEFGEMSGLCYQTTVTDPAGNIKKTFTDGRGLTVAVVEKLKGNDIITKYEYDAMKQITAVIDHQLNRTTITYDKLGRRTSINNPDTGLVSYNFDSAGNLISKQTPNLKNQNKMIQYLYQYNRLESIVFPDKDSVLYKYGNPGSVYNRAGRIESVDNGTMKETFFYGSLGEVLESHRTIKVTEPTVTTKTFKTRYRFDNMGRMLSMVYPDNSSVSYGYDKGGLLKSVMYWKNGRSENIITDIQYNHYGQRMKVFNANNTITDYSYDDKMRRLKTLITTNGDGKKLQNLVYVYDDVGNIIRKTNNGFIMPSGETKTTIQNYSYDDLNRLTNSDGDHDSGKNKYTNEIRYDIIGNITYKSQNHRVNDVTNNMSSYTQTYSYNPSNKPHAVTKTEGTVPGTDEKIGKTYTYDANGNMISQVSNAQFTRTYTWDSQNRLIKSSEPGTSVNYAYDVSGNRVRKSGPYGETIYATPNYSVKGGSIKSLHIFAGKSRVATKMVTTNTDGTEKEDGTYYYHKDHLGSSSSVSDASGVVHEYLEYFPYGETWIEKRRSSDPTTIQFKYTGKELDRETGLYYYGARYYDARLSRWISADPPLMTGEYLPSGGRKPSAGMGGVFRPSNLACYQYAGNNPIVVTDPDGNTEVLAKLFEQFGTRIVNPIDPISMFNMGNQVDMMVKSEYVKYDIIPILVKGDVRNLNDVWQLKSNATVKFILTRNGEKMGVYTYTNKSKKNKYYDIRNIAAKTEVSKQLLKDPSYAVFKKLIRKGSGTWYDSELRKKIDKLKSMRIHDTISAGEALKRVNDKDRQIKLPSQGNPLKKSKDFNLPKIFDIRIK